MAKKKSVETNDQKEFKDRIKAARVNRGLSWAEMDMLLEERRLDVMAAPSSRPTPSRMIEISRKLDGLPDVEAVEAVDAEKQVQQAAPVIDHKRAEQQRENLKPQLQPAAETNAQPDIAPAI